MTQIKIFMNNYNSNPSNTVNKQMAERIAREARSLGCNQSAIDNALQSDGGRPRSVFADGVGTYNTGTKAPEGSFRNPSAALGSPNWDRSNTGFGFVSLGCGGAITLSFSGGNNMNIESIRVHEVGTAVEATRVDVNTRRGWLFVGNVGGSVDAVSLRPPQPVSTVKLTDLKENCDMPTPGADIDAVELIGR